MTSLCDAERLLSIIENLLLLTRLESGTRSDLEPEVLGRIATKIVDAHRGRHPDRKITLIDDSTRPLIVEADEGYLEVLVGNLINNAMKYSPAESEIDVAIDERDGVAEVAVRDRGIGLSPEDLEAVLNAFYRSPAARGIGNGVGIGLTVCRRLVEALGGKIWAQSREGGGSEFVFSLPLHPDRESR